MACPCEYIILARRSGTDWYVGSLTNWDERNSKLPLDFLGEGKYVAEIYADAPDAATNATHTPSPNGRWTGATVLDIHMVSGGGNAIWIHPAGLIEGLTGRLITGGTTGLVLALRPRWSRPVTM